MTPLDSGLLDALKVLHDWGAVDLTSLAGSGALPAAHGIDETVGDLIACLSDRRSALLMGPPGVGKTATIHQLAHRLARREVPEALRPAHLVQLSTGAIEAIPRQGNELLVVSLKRVLEALLQGRQILLYLTDVWNLPNAGRYTDRAGGFVTELLPYLQRRDVTILGETTPDNFSLANAPGSIRRFALSEERELLGVLRLIHLTEPDVDRTRAIVGHAIDDLAGPGRVEVTPEALGRGLALTRRFQPDQAWPGKAIQLFRTTIAWERRDAGRTLPPDGDEGAAPLVLTPDPVIDGFVRLSGLPAKILSDRVPLGREAITDALTDRVKGQPRAVAEVVDLITLIKAELTDPDRPLGVLFFVGPTGSGKTLLAKTLAEFLFESPSRLIRFDMSEYQHEGSVPDFLDRLVEAGRRAVFGVVLLDEFEKAAGPIYDLLLQVFDEGRLTDTRGRTADLRNLIVVMTSNLGSGGRAARDLGLAGTGGRARDRRTRLVQTVEGYFRPEFVNRLRSIVVFQPLDRTAMREIAAAELGAALERQGLDRRQILIDYHAEVLDLLVRAGFDEAYGARPLQRAIQEMVLLPIARRIAARPDLCDQLLELRAVNGVVEATTIPLDTAEALDPPVARTATSHDAIERAAAGLQERIAAGRASDKLRAFEETRAQLLAETQHRRFRADGPRGRWVYRSIHSLSTIMERWNDLAPQAGALIGRARAGDGRAAIARLEAELRALEAAVTLAEIELMATDPGTLASQGAFVTVRPLVRPGGSPADDWAARLRRQYQAWAERHGYEVRPAGEAGEAGRLLILRGAALGEILAGEAGVHRWEGRRAGSGGRGGSTARFALVEVLPLRSLTKADLAAIESEIELRTLPDQPAQPGAGRAAVDAVHRPSGQWIRLEGEDAPTLARAWLATRLDRLTDPAANTIGVARVYSEDRGDVVRDPRTHARIGSPARRPRRGNRSLPLRVPRLAGRSPRAARLKVGPRSGS